MSDMLTTLWVRTEGVASMPLLCAEKGEALAAGAALDAARITMAESEWAPCCRVYPDVACIRDQFSWPVLERQPERRRDTRPRRGGAARLAKRPWVAGLDTRPLLDETNQPGM